MEKGWKSIREPTEAELKEWLYQKNKEIGLDEEEDGACKMNLDHVGGACVIEGYITGCPGYMGPVGVIVWDGAPGYVDTFVREILGRDADNHPIYGYWRYATERD
jgi:hypothetical protein